MATVGYHSISKGMPMILSSLQRSRPCTEPSYIDYIVICLVGKPSDRRLMVAGSQEVAYVLELDGDRPVALASCAA